MWKTREGASTPSGLFAFQRSIDIRQPASTPVALPQSTTKDRDSNNVGRRAFTASSRVVAR